MFYQIVGLTLPNFEDLKSRTSKLLEEVTLENKHKHVSGRPRKLSAETQLLIALIYMRNYPTQLFMSWILNIAPSSLSIHINFVFNVLYKTFYSEVIIPKRETIIIRNDIALFMDNLANKIRNITVCIDGSEQQIYKPSDSGIEEFHYSGKKAKHTITLLLACSPKGKIYWISNSYPGSMNDQGLFNLTENQFHLFLAPDNGILCDAGFTAIDSYPNFIVSLKKPKNGELTPEQVLYNNRIKSIRIVVENVFSHLKRWAICSDLLRSPVINGNANEVHHKLWRIVAGFHNNYGEELRT